ncbi:Rne/Rng family ribonuclease [Victivallis sp. Marseille-Q1083]|uniref:Rne/Rng family ribonuclease n=1 Tax=Victivallis sp. Marseille-Q1083 TaxID=2717288 RepID=UPI0015894E7E|nr:Rne/Rng family ribonuclease [Victivallis sp. Marseille-Q1083]
MVTPTKKTIILNCEKLERRFAQLSNGRLEEYQLEREEDDPRVGSIYLGRIINLEPTLQAAFVDIGAGKNAFLHYWDMLPGGDELLEKSAKVGHEEVVKKTGRNNASRRGGENDSARASQIRAREKRRQHKMTVQDIPELFPNGTELLVQVVKGPIGTKGARVTTNISIAGRYLVLLPYSDHIGLSTKIDNEQERSRLRKILASLEVPEGIGLICRTVGEGRKSIFFKRDLDLLLDYWRRAEEAVNKRRAPTLVYAEPNLIERTVRDFMTEDIAQIIVDDPDAYRDIYNALKKFGGGRMAAKVSRYDRAEPIFDHYRVKTQLADVFRREVQLPSGGYICIDETEALIAIDVNTGRGKRNGDQPEIILQTNLEAAEEIARQLRLRNIGGLVVLDFIDMRSMKDREELFKYMKKLVKDDRAKTKVLPLSKLGLMEMTRQREHESVKDTVYDPCPYCHGSGRVKSAMSMSVEIQRQLNALMKNGRHKGMAVRVLMHPEVLDRLKNEDASLLHELEERYENTLSFRADPALHYEEFYLIDPASGAKLK